MVILQEIVSNLYHVKVTFWCPHFINVRTHVRYFKNTINITCLFQITFSLRRSHGLYHRRQRGRLELRAESGGIFVTRDLWKFSSLRAFIFTPWALDKYGRSNFQCSCFSQVHVKPYIFFKNTGDINAPPGLPPKFTPDHQPDVDYQRKGNLLKKTTTTPHNVHFFLLIFLSVRLT